MMVQAPRRMHGWRGEQAGGVPLVELHGLDLTCARRDRIASYFIDLPAANRAISLVYPGNPRS